MRSRRKDSTSTRRDALVTGADKAIVADCPGCADGYFALARAHGATEADVEAALRAAEERHAQLLLNRRTFLKLTATGAAGVALGGLGVLPGNVARATAASESLDGAVWVQAYRSPQPGKGEPPTRLIGISANGQIIARLDPLVGTPLRSADGRRLVVVSPSGDVAVYDALSGALLRQMSAGAPAAAPEGSPLGADIVPALSADGTRIALLRQTDTFLAGTPKTLKKGGAYGIPEYSIPVGERASSLTLEVLNLTSGASLGSRALETEAAPIRYAGALFAPAGPEILVSYLRDDRAVLRRYSAAGAAVAEQRANTAPAAVLPNGLPRAAQRARGARFLPDWGSIAAFASAERLVTFDAATLGESQAVAIPPLAPVRGEPTLILAASGQAGYVVQPHGEAIQFVDLPGATVATLQLPAGAAPAASTYPMVAFGRADYGAAAARLYVAHGEYRAGLTVVDVDARRVVGRFLETTALAGIWVAPDERFLVAPDTVGALHLLDPNGSARATVPIGSVVLGLL